MDYLMAFIVGGIICAIGQILIDKTKLLPAHILVLFVVAGALLSGIGIYEKLIKIGGAGATIPLTGFGHSLAQGAIEGAQKLGLIGAFGGAIQATAVGISAAIIFGFLASVLFNPKS